jgi:ParB family chromosome partitioning protein|nr:MAG TPA: chromosome partitioning protein [Caudoviricetes sp.]
MENSGIVFIKAEQIYQHPDNPRKDLGDLSELSESIKKKGIMQNLTVIPGHWDDKKEWHEDGYTLIIGHRRFAAGKLAEVAEFPCRIVTDMDKKDQVGTMLEENMQRNDLTVFEQAQGFQMMLDLGETEDSISEKTGFSKKTVKHRLNLAKLNQAELKKKTDEDGSFQLSLKDLYELEKIEDIKTRDKVLKQATDSRDLVWKAKQAVQDETRARNLKAFKELFKKAGIKQAPKEAENERYSGKWESLQEWELDNDAPKTLKKFKEENPQWIVFWGRTIAVIVPAKKKEKKLSEYEIKEKEKQKAKKALKQKCKDMFEKADIFIKEVIAGEIQPLKEDVELYKELTKTLIEANVNFYRSDLALLYSGKGLYELEHDEPEKFKEFCEWEAKLTPIQSAMAYMSCIKKTEIYSYNVEYSTESARRINAVFDFLAKYGFSVSEEEEQILDGTHELFQKRG